MGRIEELEKLMRSLQDTINSLEDKVIDMKFEAFKRAIPLFDITYFEEILTKYEAVHGETTYVKKCKEFLEGWKKQVKDDESNQV